MLLKHIPLPQYTILVAWDSKPHQMDTLVLEMPTVSDCGLSYYADCLQLSKVLSSETNWHQPPTRGRRVRAPPASLRLFTELRVHFMLKMDRNGYFLELSPGFGQVQGSPMEAEEGLLFIDPRMQLPRKDPTDWGVPTCGQRGIYSESLGPGEKSRVLQHGQQGTIRSLMLSSRPGFHNIGKIGEPVMFEHVLHVIFQKSDRPCWRLTHRVNTQTQDSHPQLPSNVLWQRSESEQACRSQAL